ncbi:Transposon Ty3-I Gag-Pol polyprotein [Gossypium australe]|uniref:Transposon Ty3-I Gag-Pol polyprotein n=1 Tax=Gossypium australe TaxID=47621 RepID=A0A5B6W7V8_9ROSI|nr:Transposon Ty3-I Gag-Pol polyprotein [Gossypium australe]
MVTKVVRRLSIGGEVVVRRWKLGIGKARPITVTLKLANHSYAPPESKIEDVLIKEEFESLDLLARSFKPPRPSIKEPPTLELKALLLHLKYAYLGNINTLIVVISAELTPDQETKLLDVLRRSKKTLGWTITDINGIRPAICMHNILLKDCHSNSIEQQKRLNPIIKEVVKKEVIKWLDTSIIYLISDSLWHMMAIFSDMVEKFFDVFMDNFSVFDDTFENCLKNLELVLCRWIFMDKAKIEVIEKLPPPTTVKGAVLGQRKDKVFHAIYYVNRTLTDIQLNYTTTENELLPVIFTFDKFRFYLVGTKVTVYTDHSVIRYLVTKKGTENQVADHLSRIQEGNEYGNIQLIKEEFPDEQLLVITALPRYSDIVNFLVSGLLPLELTIQRRKKFLHDAKQYYWDEPFLFKHYADQIIRRCIPNDEIQSILQHYHSAPCGGHFGGMRTAAKVFQSSFYWPSLFKDAHEFY